MNGITFPKLQTFAYRQSVMSLRSQLTQPTNEPGLIFARFSTAEYCEATLLVFHLGTKSATDATTQLLSPVLGSAAVVTVAALGLRTLTTVVLVTVVVVLVVVAAGLIEGFAVGTVVGSPAAGLASAGACPRYRQSPRPCRSPPPEAWRHRAQPPHAVPSHRRHPTRR